MLLTNLDDYSITAIIQHLDITSYKSFLQVCKRFNQIARKNVNALLWKHQIKHEFIKSIQAGSNRDNISATMFYKYTLDIVLKSLLQTARCIEFLSSVQLHKQREGNRQEGNLDSENNINESNSKLSLALIDLLREAVFCETTGMKSLCDIGYNTGMKINNWYMYHTTCDTLVYICNVEHPEQHVNGKNENAIIGIIHNEIKHSTKVYCYNVTQIDWYVYEISDAKFSKSKDVLKPVCCEMQKLFPNIEVSPDLLIALGNIDLAQVSIQKNKPSLFAKAEEICNIRTNFSKDFSNLPEETMKLMSTFMSSLKIFCNVAPFNKVERFLQCLIESTAPFFKTFAVFGYGELLAYLPLTEKMLLHVDICSRCYKDGEECIDMSLNNNKLRLTLHCTVPTWLHIFQENNINITWTDSFSQDSENEEKLIVLFEEFVSENFSSEEVVDIPVLNLRFIERFIQLLFSRDVPENLQRM